jgi:metal-sulfur cluster biosynthetic enzyme
MMRADVPEVLLDALNGVKDPELGLGIVDLGLVYDLEVAAGQVAVTMTFTAQGCPMTGAIEDGVRRVLLAVPGIRGVDVRITWEPPWRPEFISPVALRALTQGEQ